MKYRVYITVGWSESFDSNNADEAKETATELFLKDWRIPLNKEMIGLLKARASFEIYELNPDIGYIPVQSCIER